MTDSRRKREAHTGDGRPYAVKCSDCGRLIFSHAPFDGKAYYQCIRCSDTQQSDWNWGVKAGDPRSPYS